MSLLIETIQIKNGELQLLSYHQKRMNKSIEDLFNIQNSIVLEEKLTIPEEAKTGVWKCRIVYSKTIHEISFSPYIYRTINSLQIVDAPNIDYSYKYENRENLQNLLGLKKDADEILITKENHITDTSFSNIIFFDGKDWVTPKTYLLEGTKRAYLIEMKQIKVTDITIDNLYQYKKARLINCFFDLENGNDIEMRNIRC